MHFNKHSDDSDAGVPLLCLREEELELELIRGPEHRPQAQGTVIYVKETVRL